MPISTFFVSSTKKEGKCWTGGGGLCTGASQTEKAMLSEEEDIEANSSSHTKRSKKRRGIQRRAPRGLGTIRENGVEEVKQEIFDEAYTDTIGAPSRIEARLGILERQFRQFARRSLKEDKKIKHHIAKRDAISSCDKAPPEQPRESSDNVNLTHHSLQWAEDYKRWLNNEDDDDEDEDGSPSIETVEKEWLDILVANVEQPSIYLLASTPETFGFNRPHRKILDIAKEMSKKHTLKKEDDDADTENILTKREQRLADKKERRRTRRLRRKNKQSSCRRCCTHIHETLKVTRMHTVIMTLLLVMLTYLTILFPLIMLANFWKRSLDWTDVSISINEKSRHTRQSHRLYLKFTSAILLAYLFYTSLSILDEVKVFRFFLLGSLPMKVEYDSTTNAEESMSAAATVKTDEESLEVKIDTTGQKQQQEVKKKDVTGAKTMARGLGFIGKKGFKLVKDFFGQDSLIRPILIIGMVSKLASLVCVIQLTYLIFRVSDFQIIELILNSVALQFLQQIDATLGSAIRNTPAMTRYFSKAVNELRVEAQSIVDSPDLVADIVEPSTDSWAQLLRNTISNEYADRLVQKYPRIFSWLPHEASSTPLDAPQAHDIYEQEQDSGLPVINPPEELSSANTGAPPAVDTAHSEDRKSSLDSMDSDAAVVYSNSRIMRRRIFSRSEVVHRVIHNFIIFYGTTLILLQVFGNIFCSWRSICSNLSNQSDNDREPEATVGSTRRLSSLWLDSLRLTPISPS